MTCADEQLTLGQEIIAWIETHCRIPEGALVGQPLELMDWQRNFILQTYNNPARTRRAILSVPRKCGKTCLAACLLLVHLVGPAAIPNGQCFSCAMSRDQAALLYGLAAKMVRMSPSLSNQVVCKDGIKQLVCPARGSAYRALSSESAVAYGLSPAFVVHDELGLVRGPRSELRLAGAGFPLLWRHERRRRFDAAVRCRVSGRGVANGRKRTIHAQQRIGLLLIEHIFQMMRDVRSALEAVATECRFQRAGD